MSFALDRARATIKKITPDKKADGDGAKALVAALRVEVKTSADVLAEFHPQLRAAWFVKDGGVRFPSMKEVGWEGTRRSVDLSIRPGPDLAVAVTLSDVTLRDFKMKPIEESGAQMVAMRFVVDVKSSPPLSRLAEYLKEEAWIDVQGGGELDLPPPAARTEIPEIAEAPKGNGSAATAPASTREIAAVRLLQPSRKGVRARLATYADEVLRAAIAAETTANDSRPMFISMLEGELKRRHETH